MLQSDGDEVLVWCLLEDGFKLADELWCREAGGPADFREVEGLLEVRVKDVFGDTESSEELFFGAGLGGVDPVF